MKGDEVVETREDIADCLLFGDAWIGDVDLLEVLVVEMDHGLSLGAFCHLVVRACTRDREREESLVKLIVRPNNVEVAAQQNTRLTHRRSDGDVLGRLARPGNDDLVALALDGALSFEGKRVNIRYDCLIVRV